MLLAIRERAMGVVGWILLALLFVAFAFFGLESYLGNGTQADTVTVNDVEISPALQQRAYQLMRASLQEQMGPAYNPALIDEEALKKNSLEQLIREQLLLQEADAEGFAISNQLVAAQISSVSSFREGDSFSREKYERTLRLQGMSPAEFEWRLARELMTKQIVSGIIQTAEPTPVELDEAYRIQAQQRRFKFLRLPLSRYEDQVEVSDSDITQYYETHGSDFMKPERIRIQYLELMADDIEVSGDVDDEALRELYEEQSARYVTEEERHARHILIGVLQDADEETVEKARLRAESVMERLENGESFADLAGEASDDPGSAASGGDLGFVGKGVMAPEFEAAVFSLEKGGRSDIVRSPFGFHIIELIDIKAEVTVPLEAVRDELIKEYFSQERSDLFYEKSDLLANLVFEQPDSLQEAADVLSLEMKTSDWLTRDGGPGIGENALVIRAAFQEDVLENGNNSEPLEVEDDYLVVIRVLDHETAEQRPLETVWGEVAARVHDETARELASTEGGQLLQELKSGSTIDAIASAQGLEPEDSGLVNRRAGEPERALIDAAFLLPAPVEGQSSTTGLALQGGDYVLLSLDEIKDGDLSGLSEDERKRAAQELGRIQGTSEVAAVVAELKNRASIIIPERSN